MPAGFRHGRNRLMAQFIGKLAQVLTWQPAQIRRI
jgi:hypothetical protein